MGDLLEEYKAYYKTRALRFASNANYQNSFTAEQALSNAMDSCAQLEEFKDKIGDLNERCVVALVKDEHLMEKEFFEEHEETIRALAAQRITSKVDSCANSTEVISLVQQEMGENSKEITADEWQREFQYEWSRLDNIEVYENAVVPDQYKSDMQRSADDMKQRLKQSTIDSMNEARKFKPDFQFTPDVNMETRHRRLLPYSDAHIIEQIQKYKSLNNL